MASAITREDVTFESNTVQPLPPQRNRWPIAGWALVGAVVGAALVWMAHRALIDDAYITFSYVQNLVADGHWGLIPTEESNAATSPLNVLLLAAATWLVSLVTGEVRPVAGFSLLTIALTALLTGWAAATARRLGRSSAWSLAVLAVVLANPFVNASLGMEVVLTAALLMGLVQAAVRGSSVAFGVLAGLLVLTRLDLGVIVAAVFLLSPSIRRPFWRAPVIAAAVSLPWYAFSWWHFGSAIPDTFVIKTLQESFGDATFANGLWSFWAGRGELAMWLGVAPALVGLVVVAGLLVAGVRRRVTAAQWPIAGLGLGGVAYFAAYSLLGVPPYQWYYAPSTVALGVAGVFGLALLAGRSRLAVAVPVAVAVALTALTVVALPERTLSWERPIYFGNWALPAQYLQVGEDVGRLVGDATVIAPPEIGTLAYACECSIVDAFSDPGRTLPLIEERIDQSGSVGTALLEANFVRRDESVQPREAEFELVYTKDAPPPDLPSWQVWSPATGDGTLFLQPLG
ncbi:MULTISPECIES: hypothetical protein [unclassified Modestobacter]